MEKDTKFKIIDAEEFKFAYFKNGPTYRLEAKIIFEQEHISQKLIYSLMEMSHAWGFGCSSPIFSKDDSATFCVGTIVSSRLSKSYINRLVDCMRDIRDFADSFLKQMDFSTLDLSMFKKDHFDDLSPEEIALIRDHNFNGSWESFHNELVKNDQLEEAEIILKFMEFEKINKKDIGFVGKKLLDTFLCLGSGKVGIFN